MAIWEVVKGLKPDFSNSSPEALEKLIENFNQEEIDTIVKELDEETKSTVLLKESITLAFSIAKLKSGETDVPAPNKHKSSFLSVHAFMVE